MESSEQANKVIKYLIQSCPIGEEKQILEDIEKLRPVDFSLFQQDLRKHNQDHLAIVSDGTDRVLIFQPAYQDGRYHDQVTQKAFTVDHQTNTITSSESYEHSLSESAQQFVTALSQKLKDYVTKYFKENQASQVVSDNEGNQINIGITAKNLNFSNFYGGEWISFWTLNGNQLQGTAKINTHFFEAGNVQLHQAKVLGPVQIPATQNATQKAQVVVSAIQKLQGSLQSNLGDLYEEIPDKFFKSLRRLLPLTKVKMDWSVSALGIRQNLLNMAKGL